MQVLDTNLFRFVWRHSRGEQILILSIILASLPFYFASLDIPKKIVNDALQGRAFKDGRATATLFDWSFTLPELLGGHRIVLSPGVELDQIPYLFALSGLFLLLVLITGAFKFSINIRKGILGERMLRRLRFELFALLLRFRPEDIRAVKPSEAASMIKDEVEPIGGFIGDAFIQPFFLGTQALTALVFIMVQSFWLGLIALAVVLVQAFVIPNLRREQIRLGRERQIASRHLAGRIGEVVEGAPAVHIHGTGPYERAEVGGRLGRLFGIRADLFRRKFAVKYLNNLLAQVTPFFFYAVGGYLALTGSIDIGQLVAVIAAYRDLPPPIKELIDWDQQRADVTVKYQQIVSQFTVERLLPGGEEAGDRQLARLEGPIVINGLRVVDRRGTALLETLSLTIERPCHVALAGAGGSGRDILAKVLGRQISEFDGTVRVGGHNLFELRDEVAGRFLAYAGAEPLLFSGTIRDNVAYSLRRAIPPEKDVAELSPKERLRYNEALLSGNPTADPDADGIDYEAAGIRSPEELDSALLHALRDTGMQEEIYRLGLNGRLGPEIDGKLASTIIEARGAVREELNRRNLTRLVEPFDPNRYNSNATIGENLLFGVPVGQRLAESGLASDPYFRAILEAEALVEPLTEIGLRIAETTAEIFSGLPPGHPLFERFSFIRSDEMEEFQRLLDTVQQHEGRAKLSTEGRNRLIGLALGYIEPRHRLSVVDDTFRARALRARRSFVRYLPREYADKVEFYEPDKLMTAAPLRDNLLFGRIGFGGSSAEQRVWDVVSGKLAELGLEQLIYKLGLDYEVGPGGKLLFGPQRTSVNLARCLVKRPEVLILDGALSAYGGAEAKALLDRIREAMAGRTLIVTISEVGEARGFDRVIRFEGARAVLTEAEEVEGARPSIGAHGLL
jgi:putative ABC transport system ATP-binding protein